MLRNRILIMLGASFLAATAAWADDVGYVDCNSHSEGGQLFGKPRKTPDTIGTLPCGERFTILVYGFYFSRVQTKDGQIGYVYSNIIAVDRAATAAPQTGQPTVQASAQPAGQQATSLTVASEKTKIPRTQPFDAQPAPAIPAPPRPAPAQETQVQTAPAQAPAVTAAANTSSTPASSAAAPAANVADTAAAPTPQPAADQPAAAQPAPAVPSAQTGTFTTPPTAPATTSVEEPAATTAQPSAPAVAQPEAAAPQPQPAATEAQPAPAQPTAAQPEPTPAKPVQPSIRPADTRSSWERPLPSAHKAPLFELYGGYAFARMGGAGSSGTNMNGGLGAVGWNARPWLQVLGDTSYSMTTVGSTKNVLYGNHYGARLIYRGKVRWGLLPFAEGLVGGSSLKTTVSGAGGYTASTGSAISYKVGGGVDIHPSKRWEIRLFDFDYYRTTFTGSTQPNNYWISTGVVLRLFGGGYE